MVICEDCQKRDGQVVTMKLTYAALFNTNDMRGGSPIADVTECPRCGASVNVYGVGRNG